MKYFGYQKSVGGNPAPVLWHDKPTDGNNKELIESVYYKFSLNSDDERLSFEELKIKYPFQSTTKD